MKIKYKDLDKLQKEKTVYTAGSFDLFHSGHVNYLKQIKDKFPNHKLVVGVLSDERIKSKKGEIRPILKQSRRIIVIDAIKYVDFSFIVPASERVMAFLIINKLKPEYIVFPQKKYMKYENRFREMGSKIIIQSRYPDLNSTTRIIEKIRKNG